MLGEAKEVLSLKNARAHSREMFLSSSFNDFFCREEKMKTREGNLMVKLQFFSKLPFLGVC